MYFACSTKLHSEFFFVSLISALFVVHDSLARLLVFGWAGADRLKVGGCATATFLLVYSGLTISSVWTDDEHER